MDPNGKIRIQDSNATCYEDGVTSSVIASTAALASPSTLSNVSSIVGFSADFATSQRWGPLTFTSPGVYTVCYCLGNATADVDCTVTDGFTVRVGTFRVDGPLTFMASGRGGWDGWVGDPAIVADAPVVVTHVKDHSFTATLTHYNTTTAQVSSIKRGFCFRNRETVFWNTCYRESHIL